MDKKRAASSRAPAIAIAGSACSIALMRNPDAAGSLSGLHLIVEDIEVTRG